MPGLATATVLRGRGHEVTLWLTGKTVEDQSVESWEGEIIRVPAQGFPTQFSLTGLAATWKLWRAGAVCRKRMRAKEPHALLAMGSYASAGPVLAARKLRIPYILHEANVLPGRAVTFLARWATVVACHFEETNYYLHIPNLHVTGMPLRPELNADEMDEAAVFPDPDRFTILVMGGSHGAHALNEIATEAITMLAGKNGVALQVIHLSGGADEEWVRERYDEAGVPAQVQAFSGRIAPLYRAANLAICRAGASTCAELSLFGVPSLMIPYPYAANDHQTANARALEKAGAVDVVPEKDLSVAWLVDYIDESMRNPKRLARMGAAMKTRTPCNGAERLADLVEKAAAEQIAEKGIGHA